MVLRVRRADAGDLDAILAIQAASYPPALVEDRAVFARQLGHAWVAEAEAGEVVGYLVAHPWHTLQRPPRLHSVEDVAGALQQAEGAEGFFLHDVTVHPAHRGRGVAAALLEHAFQEAEAAAWWWCLVAVNGTAEPFWKARWAFERVATAETEVQAAALLTYADPTAAFMVRWMRRDRPARGAGACDTGQSGDR